MHAPEMVCHLPGCQPHPALRTWNAALEAIPVVGTPLSVLFAHISQQKTHIQAYIRTQKRTRSYTEED